MIIIYGYTVFHKKIMENLFKCVKNNSVSHAYIFEGNEGLNLKECALLFAMSLTCKSQNGAPCTDCDFCRESIASTNPDIILFKKPSDKKTIGVDSIRDLSNDTLIKPYGLNYKVYIIEDGDLLTVQAQNALLKTLEEPPKYVVFIILTSNKNILLDTILSRSTTIYFPPVSDSEVLSYINSNYPDIDNPDLIVKLCEGIPKSADKIINDENFNAVRDESFLNLPLLLTKDKLSAFKIKDFLIKNSEHSEDIIDFWTLFVRDILIFEMGCADKIINIDKFDAIRNLANKLNPKILVSAINELLKAKEMLSLNVSLKSVALSLPLKINQ